MQPVQVFSAYDQTPAATGDPYRYCPMCGSALAALASGSQQRPTCAHCGWVHFLNPAPGVVVLVEQDGRVLLGRRASSSFAGDKWCLPGGFVEYQEDYLTAAIREVREETGLLVEIQSIISVVSNYLAPTLHTLVVVLLARVLGGQPMPGDDIVELAWFPLQGPLPDMAFEADRHIVERYERTHLQGAPVDIRYARPASRF